MDVIVEDFVPYRRSVLWRIHDHYYARRGVAAFTDGDIPWRTTNNSALAQQYAQLVLALDRARPAERADDDFTIVEIGSGSGQLAAAVLSALEHQCGDPGRALYERVRYVMTDFSAPTVRAAIEHPALRDHVDRGRLIPAIFDLRTAEPPRTLADVQIAPPPELMIANYLACVGPTTHVRRDDRGLSELYAQVVAEDPADPDAVPADADALVALYARDRAVTMKAYGRNFEWRPHTSGTPFDDPFHARVLERVLAGADATLAYPYGFFDLLRGVGAWLAADARILVTDYGYPQRDVNRRAREPRPVLYGDSLNHAIDFVTLDACAAELGWDVVRTDDALRSVQQVLLAREPLSPALRVAFAETFVRRTDGDDLLDFLVVARKLVADGEHARAARFFVRAAALDPRNPALHYELAETCIAAREPQRAIAHLTRCAQLDTANVHDTEFQLGVACYELERYDDALAHYERSLAREDHAITWWNIALAHRGRGDLKATARALDRSLALDPAYAPALEMAQTIQAEWWRGLVGT